MGQEEPHDIVLHVDGFDLLAQDSSDEPRLHEDEVARRFGYSRERDFRRVVRALVKEQELPGVLARAETARARNQHGPMTSPRTRDVYYLTEANIVVATMHARTPIAKALRQKIAAAIVKARRELRAAVPVTVDATLISGPRIEDDLARKRSLQQIVKATSGLMQAKASAVASRLASVFGVKSIYRASLVFAPMIERTCDEWAKGLAPIPPITRIPPSRQLDLFEERTL